MYFLCCVMFMLQVATDRAATKEEIVALILKDWLECISYVVLCLCYRLPLTEQQTKSRWLLFVRRGMRRRYGCGY